MPESPSSKRRSRTAFFLGLIAWAALLLWGAAWIHAHGITPRELPGFLHQELGNSPWAVLAIVALFIIRPFILLPVWTLCVASGVLFGPTWGIVVSVVADNLSANLIFLSARAYARSSVAPRRVPPIFKKIDHALAGHGFLAVFLLRFVYIPFDGLSIVAGLTHISFGAFVLATFLGTLPGIAAYTLLGGAAHNLHLIPALLAVFLLVGGAGYLVRRARAAKGLLQEDQG